VTRKQQEVETEPMPPRLTAKLSPEADDSRARATRGRARARQIMEVAERLFNEHGFSETSMDDIANAVGILKGSLYYYIRTKGDLLFQIASAVHDVVDEKTAEAQGREDLSPLDRVVHFVESQVQYNAHNVVRIAVYHHEWRRLTGPHLEEIRRRRHDHAVAMRGLLELARETGEIPADTDLDLALNNVFAVTIWPYTWYHEGGAVSPERLAKSCAEFVRRALVYRA